MSRVRTHFCTLVARGNGAGSRPVRYGMNGTMPATVNSSEGSGDTSEALGTTVWPRSAKCSRKRRRISAVCIRLYFVSARAGVVAGGGRGLVLGGVPSAAGQGEPLAGGQGERPPHGYRRVEAGGGAQLGLALGGG